MRDADADDDWTPRRTAAVVAGIVAATTAIVAVIYATEPQAVQEGATKRTPMLVEVTSVQRGDFQPELVALGSVRPSQDVEIAPQVSGQVIALGEDFVPGRTVAENAVIVRLDPADARNRLEQQRSALRQAESDLALERGRQAVAAIEREQIGGDISPEQEALVLREPQLAAAEARVTAARSAVRQAELDLERTTVRAPFDALVLSRDVGTGSQVRPSSILGRLVATDHFWVEVSLPARRLGELDVGSRPEVRLRDRASFPEGASRVGRLDSIVRQVDDQTRLARLLVIVDDPLALDPHTKGPPLLAGAFVEARIPGTVLTDVVRLERELLRQGDTVWVMESGALRIRNVEVVVEDAEHAYLRAGLADDAQVVTTNLATVTDGAPLRLERP